MAQHMQKLKSKSAAKQAEAAKALLSESTEKYAEGFEPTAEQRHDMIAKEAYLIAEQRGFEGDRQMEDWLQAEATIASRFVEKH